MNRIAAIFVLLCLGLGLLTAQELTPWQYVRHSAVDNNNQVHVRFNGTPSIIGQYELHNWVNSQWLGVPLTNPDDYLYEGLLPYIPGQTMRYRLKTTYETMNMSVTALNPAFLSNDAFPPAVSALGYINDDPVGDSLMIYVANLDLTGSWFGFSNNKLYTALSNQTNTFPVMNSFTSYNMYFAGLANTATAITDSTIYAMLYTFNIPGLFSSGLYKLGMNLADSSLVYQRLGNIQAQVVNGKLVMSCNISDLTADPAFGEWPPLFNSLGYMAGSMRIGINLSTMTPSFDFGDYTNPAQLVFENHNYIIIQNFLPEISDVSVTSAGINLALQFTYYDANQDFPLYCKAILDNQAEIEITPTVPDFTQAVTMTAILPNIGWQTGTIRISDNLVDYVTADITNTAVQDEYALPAFNCTIYPNPFNPEAGNLTVSFTNKGNAAIEGSIYNLKGQCIRHLQGQAVKGSGFLLWDGLDNKQTTVANGIYLLKLNDGQQTISKKIIIVR